MESNLNYIKVSFLKLESIKLFTKYTCVRNIILWCIYTFQGKKTQLQNPWALKWLAMLSAT